MLSASEPNKQQEGSYVDSRNHHCKPAFKAALALPAGALAHAPKATTRARVLGRRRWRCRSGLIFRTTHSDPPTHTLSVTSSPLFLTVVTSWSSLLPGILRKTGALSRICVLVPAAHERVPERKPSPTKPPLSTNNTFSTEGRWPLQHGMPCIEAMPRLGFHPPRQRTMRCEQGGSYSCAF